MERQSGSTLFELLTVMAVAAVFASIAVPSAARMGAAVIPALFIGFIGGAIIGVAIVAASKGDGKTAIPFGPFLAAGAVVALFAGTPLIDAYLSLALGR